jgi:hypothetical protein
MENLVPACRCVWSGQPALTVVLGITEFLVSIHRGVLLAPAFGLKVALPVAAGFRRDFCSLNKCKNH